MDKPELCDRCKQVMSEVWFHKKDDFEDVNICLLCYEKEYGYWEAEDDSDIVEQEEETD